MTKTPLRKKAPKNAPRRRRKATKQKRGSRCISNSKVPADFRREFKTYAAQHNKKLNQLLFEAFAALKAKHAG